MKIQDLAYMSISLALVIVCSKITFHIGPIPITLQTFAVIFTGLFLKTKSAFIVFLCYILMGLAGIPVFSSGGGFTYIFQPSFGFILGFLCSVFITGSQVFKKYKITVFIKSFLGLLLIDGIGLLYMALILKGYLHLEVTFIYILEIGFIPFIFKDMISSVLAALVSLRLSEVICIRDLKENIRLNKKENGNV